MESYIVLLLSVIFFWFVYLRGAQEKERVGIIVGLVVLAGSAFWVNKHVSSEGVDQILFLLALGLIAYWGFQMFKK